MKIFLTKLLILAATWVAIAGLTVATNLGPVRKVCPEFWQYGENAK